MKYKIGVLGSAEYPEQNFVEKAEELGRELISRKDEIIVCTGACSGLPYAVASVAAKGGVEVWGFSPAADFAGQKKEMPNEDLSIFRKFFYLPKDFPFINDINISRKYRNIILTASVEAGIIVGGRFGTLNEFTNLYDMGKIIGVYEGTGGVADEIAYLIKKINKKTQAQIVFEHSPKKLLEKIFCLLREQKKP